MRSLPSRLQRSRSLHLTRLLYIGPCLILATGVASWGIQRNLRRRDEKHQERDMRTLRESLANAPPPPLREIGLLSPYPSVKGFVNVVEIGGSEHAATEFSLPKSGLNVSVNIHTCRPRAMSGNRLGEINFEDGSDADLCTSGGMIVITRPDSSEEFPIFFKLLGSPPGIIQWNARKFVEPRGDTTTWEDSLRELQSELQPSLLRDSRIDDPATVRTSGSNLETIDPHHKSAWLMSGPRDEMQRLLEFRHALRDLYREQDAPRARRVVGLVLDSLLTSQSLLELSEAWRHELQDGQGAPHL